MNALPKARRRHVLVAAGLATVLVGGGAGVAIAAGTTSGSATPSTSPSAGPGSTAKPPAPKPRSPHLDGTVTALASATITIKDRDGFTRTIRTSSATKYTDGLTAAPKTGTEIHAEGTVDQDGTSLDATTVGTRPTPPAGGDGHGPGQDGPGRGGPGHAGGPDKNGGPRPTGAPSGTATPQPPASSSASSPAPSAS